MGHLRSGEQDAARELVDAFYPELRQMAAARMRNEKPGHTWQPTVLVHELYVELTRLRGLNTRSYKEEQEQAAFLNRICLPRRILHVSASPWGRSND